MSRTPPARRPSRGWVAFGALALAVVAVAWSWRATRPRITATAPPGAQALHYEVLPGPRPGLREELIANGTIVPDAIDNGLGRFVDPATLTEQERRDAAQRVAWREASRRGRSTQETP